MKYLKSLTVQERAKLADLAHIGSDYLYQIMIGYRKPKLETALRIEAASQFKITKEELRPDLYRALK